MRKKKHNKLNFLLILFFIAALICGGWFYREYREKAAADIAADEIQQLKPPADNVNDDESMMMDIGSIQTENPDIIAWLTVPGTIIDYPVVQAYDNDYYLHHDAQKNSNINGALFLDFRVHNNFSDFNNVIYGHNMNSGRMFQNLINFKERSFFDSHTSAVLFTEDKTWSLEIFAVAVISPYSELYNYAFVSINEKERHLQTIKEKAMFYRDTGVTANDRIVILSTCSYEYEDARTAVVARLFE